MSPSSENAAPAALGHQGRSDWFGAQTLVEQLEWIKSFFSSPARKSYQKPEYKADKSATERAVNDLSGEVDELLAYGGMIEPRQLLVEISNEVKAFSDSASRLTDSNDVREKFMQLKLDARVGRLRAISPNKPPKHAYLSAADFEKTAKELRAVSSEATVKQVADRLDKIGTNHPRGILPKSLIAFKAFVTLHDTIGQANVTEQERKFARKKLNTIDLISPTKQLEQLADPTPTLYADELNYSMAKSLISPRTAARYQLSQRAFNRNWA